MYFALFYHSRERGLYKNTNGLIRQYFTKGNSFENITDNEVEAVMNMLNHRSRKTLNFKTPDAVFLLSYCEMPLEFQDCTTELNPEFINTDIFFTFRSTDEKATFYAISRPCLSA